MKLFFFSTMADVEVVFAGDAECGVTGEGVGSKEYQSEQVL